MKSLTLYSVLFFAYFLLNNASSLLIEFEPSAQQLASSDYPCITSAVKESA